MFLIQAQGGNRTRGDKPGRVEEKKGGGVKDATERNISGKSEGPTL